MTANYACEAEPGGSLIKVSNDDDEATLLTEMP